MSPDESPAWSAGETVAVALSLALGGGLIAWMLSLGPGMDGDPQIALLGYLLRAAVALVVSGIVCVLARATGRTRLLTRLAWASGLSGLAVLRLAGFGPAPWVALALVLGAALATRPPGRAARGVLLPSAMGILSGLYLAFSLDRYLAAIAPMLATLRAVARLAMGE